MSNGFIKGDLIYNSDEYDNGACQFYAQFCEVDKRLKFIAQQVPYCNVQVVEKHILLH